MTDEIIVTPWSSDSEWQSVRQDIYGDNGRQNYERALRKLLLWKIRVKSLPRGLFCTELILQVITKDGNFCDVKNAVDESDLVRLYSMAIMKFVNLTADVLGKGPQKSMYFRASRLELPSWLVDMRHKISHDQDLPTLKSLRKAMAFALEWLQTKYWNEDKNFQVVAPKLNMEVVDEFNDLLEYYMFNKIPINSSSKKEHLNVLRQKLSLCEFSNKECTKKIKELIASKDWSSQLVNVFVTRYLLQAKECSVSKGRISKYDKTIWKGLLKLLTSLGLLTNVLQCLVVQKSRTAALWIVELCLVILSSRNTDVKFNQDDYCMNCKPLRLDTSLILRTSLNSTHKYTSVFLKRLLQIQSNPLKSKQQFNIVKLVSLYTGSVKNNSKTTEHTIFTVNDLMEKIQNQHPSKWSLAFGQMNWKQTPLGMTL